MNEEMIMAVASAIANARGARKGVPFFKNILDILPNSLREDVIDDARAAVEAMEKVTP